MWGQTIRFVAAFKGAPKLYLFLLLAIIGVAIFADLIAPHSPLKGDLAINLKPPVWVDGGDPSYLLGTDRYGRDILSRLIFGARISMIVAFLAIGLTATLGTFLGLISGYLGGWVDALIMRVADIFFSFPSILLALVLAVVLGPSFQNVIIIVLLILWPRFARQVRGEALSIKEKDFVTIARAMGVSPWKCMVRHIFPNVIPTLLVLCTLEVGHVVLLEATLAFLGVGIPPPNPSWGVMISEGRDWLEDAWWICLFPGISILLTVLSINMLGDWIRDRLDPKLRQI
ncbi:ABC transporter permease [Chloroflexota bacterium]